MGFISGLCFFCFGAILGFVFSILFIRNDKRWVAFVISGTTLGVFPMSFFLLFSAFKSLTNDQQPILFVSEILGFGISVIIFIWLFIRQLQKQTTVVKLTILDIFLGRSSTVEDYYNFRKDQIARELKDSENLSLQIKLRDKENELNTRQKKLEELEQHFYETIKTELTLDIKIDRLIPVTKSYLNLIPQFISRWTNFVTEFEGATQDFFKERGKHINVQEIQGYFINLSGLVNTMLFTNAPNGARTHIRILNSKLNMPTLKSNKSA